MPKLDGFEVLELIEPGPAVICVTAYDQYAMRAFDAHAVDYLLKPFSAERFDTALERARLRLGERRPPSPAGRASPSGIEAGADRGARWRARTYYPSRQARLRGSAGRLHRAALGGKSYLKQQTIAQLEAQLDPSRFVRIHRS